MKFPWKLLVLWGVGIILVFWFVYASESFQGCINGSENQTTHDTAQNGGANFFGVFGIYPRCLGGFVHLNRESITALSTLFIALFTLTLWVSTHNLWKAGERHAERELRAYVAVVPAGIGNIDPNQRLAGSIQIINGGRTPAHGMEHTAIMRMEQHPLPSNFPFPNLAGIIRPSRLVVPPQIPFGGQIAADQNFTQNQIVEILQAPIQGGRRLYFFGQIDYVDAFDVPRWTRFCYSLVGNPTLVPLAQQGNWTAIAQALSQPNFPMVFEFANQHNESL